MQSGLKILLLLLSTSQPHTHTHTHTHTHKGVITMSWLMFIKMYRVREQLRTRRRRHLESHQHRAQVQLACLISTVTVLCIGAVIMVCECDGICNDRVCSMECAVMMEFAVMVEFNNGLCCRSSGGGGVKSNSLRGSLSTSRHKVCLPLLPFHSLTALVCLFPLFSTPPSFFHLSLSNSPFSSLSSNVSPPLL